MFGYNGEDRMVGEDEVLGDITVRHDQAVDADRLEASVGARASGDPAQEHHVAIGGVFDQFRPEIRDEGNEKAEAAAQRALELSPACTAAYGTLIVSLAMLGRAGESS